MDQNKYLQVEALVKAGKAKSLTEAMNQLGLKKSPYYVWRSRQNKNKRKYVKRGIVVTDIKVPEDGKSLALILGTPNDLSKFLKSYDQ